MFGFCLFKNWIVFGVSTDCVVCGAAVAWCSFECFRLLNGLGCFRELSGFGVFQWTWWFWVF